MNAPAKQWNDSEGLQFFCRHLVALCVMFRYKTPEEINQPERLTAYSGTLIQIRENIFFLTAGHILRDLDKARSSDQVEIKNAVLADTFGLRRVCDHPIPFDLKNAQLFYIDDDEMGLDFGVIALEPYYVRLLAANGIVALDERNWINQSKVTFDGYAMLGLPEEFTSERITELGDGVVMPTMFGVRRLETPPGGESKTRHPRFIGQLNEKLPLKSVAGMSGGPIFGFCLEPQIRYWIVALQSSWNPTQRVVYGCPLPILASMMTEAATAGSQPGKAGVPQ